MKKDLIRIAVLAVGVILLLLQKRKAESAI